MTAVGGFVFDPSGNGRPDITVRVYKTVPTDANRCNPTYDDSAANAYGREPRGWYTTGSDGFYFIWQKDDEHRRRFAGKQHAAERVQVLRRAVRPHGCTPGGGTAMPFDQLYWPARSM